MRGEKRSHNAEQSLHAEKVSVAHGEFHLNSHGILEILVCFFVLLLGNEIAHDAEPMCEGQSNVQARPPAGSFIRLVGVVLVHQMHERRLVEERKHAIEILEIVLQQREGFGLRRQRPVDASLEKVLEHVGLPLYPLVVVYGGRRDHVLEGIVPRLVIDPLDALGREDGKPG